MSSAALLLIISGPQALAEDEPAARAPLPPMLRGTPAEARERQRPDPAPNHNPSNLHTPAIRFDRLKSQLSQKKPRPHSASHFGTSAAKKWERPARLADHSTDAASPSQRHRTVASEKRERQDRSPAEPEIGSFSPSSDYPDPRIGSTTVPPEYPRHAPPSTIPITLLDHPHMVTLRAIPMHGHHPDPESFGKGDPCPKCLTSLRGNAAGPAFQVDGGRPAR
jgi:hypothetical protein